MVISEDRSGEQLGDHQCLLNLLEVDILAILYGLHTAFPDKFTPILGPIPNLVGKLYNITFHLKTTWLRFALLTSQVLHWSQVLPYKES